MADVTDQTFTDEQLTIDGNRYTNCHFIRCQLTFSAAAEGGGFAGRTRFDDCQWQFVGAAAATVAFLRMMAQKMPEAERTAAKGVCADILNDARLRAEVAQVRAQHGLTNA